MLFFPRWMQAPLLPFLTHLIVSVSGRVGPGNLVYWYNAVLTSDTKLMQTLTAPDTIKKLRAALDGRAPEPLHTKLGIFVRSVTGYQEADDHVHLLANARKLFMHTSSAAWALSLHVPLLRDDLPSRYSSFPQAGWVLHSVK